MKTLILYYSHSGHTARVARLIQKTVDGDLEAIETAAAYPEDYDALVAQGHREADAGTEPAIRPLSADPAAYDRIYIGSPVWWYTMAPAVKTFLSHWQAEGKRVYPFITNEGWPGHALQDMGRLLERHDVQKGLHVRFSGDRLVTAEKEITAWCGEAVK